MLSEWLKVHWEKVKMQSKKGISQIIVLVVVLAVVLAVAGVVYTLTQKGSVPGIPSLTQKTTQTATQSYNDEVQAANAIDLGDTDPEFEQIDKDIQSL